MVLADLVAHALADGGAHPVRDLVAAVRRAGGTGVSRAAVERVLVADPRFAQVGDASRPRWQLAATSASTAASAQASAQASTQAPGQASAGERSAVTRGRLDALDLRPWQAEALAAWSTTGRGVVEAVTGTGKTRLAVAVLRIVLDRGGRGLVLVPTLELQEQWRRELRGLVPDARVGLLGGGGDDDLFSHDVVLATPHSAAGVPIEPPPGVLGVLIADEAHRYGAPTWGAALKDAFAFRLALTATYERGDEGVEDVLGPYFGEVVLRYDFARAVAEGTVAPFAIAIARVLLTGPEQEAYDVADRRARQLRRELVGPLRMPKEPRALFAAVAAVVSDGDATGRDGPQVRACREYLVRVRERRDVAATASGKLDLVAALAPALVGRRSLVFTDTVDQAEAAARLLVAGGVRAETIHGELTRDRRRIRLAQFRGGNLDAVVAPRVLDEGVDVPAADLAVVLAAFRTRRQMIQRLGRVLRLKDDGREARLVLAVAAGTAEDPDSGGHDGFLSEIRGVAREVVEVDVAGDGAAIGRWLGV